MFCSEVLEVSVNLEQSFWRSHLMFYKIVTKKGTRNNRFFWDLKLSFCNPSIHPSISCGGSVSRLCRYLTRPNAQTPNRLTTQSKFFHVDITVFS